MTFEEAELILEKKQKSTAKSGLGAVRECLRRLGSPEAAFASVHVTGTNGKGSVCAMLDEILRRSGVRTGLYTSPHLLEVTERIRVGGKDIGRQRFAFLFERVLENGGAALNFFEILTCVAFLYFAEEKVDMAVVEVGLGGRLDATNVLPGPVLSVITSVALDHIQHLGADISSIAFEKAGILKKGCPCICGPVEERARAVIEKAASEAGTEVCFTGNDSIFRVSGYDWEKGTMMISSPSGPEFKLGLIGNHQSLNASIVFKGLSVLSARGRPVPEAAVKEGFEKVKWPGRFQITEAGLGKPLKLILDGAHNPAAARAFSETFSLSPWARGGAVFLIGMLGDKDHLGMLKELAPHLGRTVVTAPPSPRALDPYLLADEVLKVRHDADVEVQSDFEAAFSSASRSGVMAVTGSFYLVGAALRALGAGKNQPAGTKPVNAR